ICLCRRSISLYGRYVAKLEAWDCLYHDDVLITINKRNQAARFADPFGVVILCKLFPNVTELLLNTDKYLVKLIPILLAEWGPKLTSLTLHSINNEAKVDIDPIIWYQINRLPVLKELGI